MLYLHESMLSNLSEMKGNLLNRESDKRGIVPSILSNSASSVELMAGFVVGLRKARLRSFPRIWRILGDFGSISSRVSPIRDARKLRTHGAKTERRTRGEGLQSCCFYPCGCGLEPFGFDFGGQVGMSGPNSDILEKKFH